MTRTRLKPTMTVTGLVTLLVLIAPGTAHATAHANTTADRKVSAQVRQEITAAGQTTRALRSAPTASPSPLLPSAQNPLWWLPALITALMTFQTITAMNDNLANFGFAIVGIFVASWTVSALVYRSRGYDRLPASQS